MSNLAYFEYETIILPAGSQKEGTPAHYLVEILIRNPETHNERKEGELERLTQDFLSLALSRGVVHIEGLKPITETEAQRLKKIQTAGTHYDGSVFLVSKV
jgi:hypothetical protein